MRMRSGDHALGLGLGVMAAVVAWLWPVGLARGQQGSCGYAAGGSGVDCAALCAKLGQCLAPASDPGCGQMCALADQVLDAPFLQALGACVGDTACGAVTAGYGDIIDYCGQTQAAAMYTVVPQPVLDACAAVGQRLVECGEPQVQAGDFEMSCDGQAMLLRAEAVSALGACAQRACAEVRPCTNEAACGFFDLASGGLPAYETQCADGVDNEGDGLTDCADSPDCDGAPECCAVFGSCGEQQCADGVDNDGDGLTDCADGDCFGAGCAPEAFCSDGWDNDGDGLVDCADGDCAGPSCAGPGAAESDCMDGIDNDGNGLTDCEEPGCALVTPTCDTEPPWWPAGAAVGAEAGVSEVRLSWPAAADGAPWGVSYEVRLDGGAVRYSWEPSTGFMRLVPGSVHGVEVVPVDLAGNRGPALPGSFTLAADAQAPWWTLASPTYVWGVGPTGFWVQWVPAHDDGALSRYELEVDGVAQLVAPVAGLMPQVACPQVLEGGQEASEEACAYRAKLQGLLPETDHLLVLRVCDLVESCTQVERWVRTPGYVAEEGYCWDGVDNDGNGLVDCGDEQACRCSPVCVPNPADVTAPAWPEPGVGVRARTMGPGAMWLQWPEAGDDHRVARYEVEVDGGVWAKALPVRSGRLPEERLVWRAEGLGGSRVAAYGVKACDGSCKCTVVISGQVELRGAEQELGRCADGVDNDGDGLVDCLDAECCLDPGCGQHAACAFQVVVEGACGDGLDGDADGAVDCADADCGGDPLCAAVVDGAVPQWPAGAVLSAEPLSPTGVEVGWPAASDDVGVASYELRWNGVLIAVAPAAAGQVQLWGLLPSTAYGLEVVARDAAGNGSTALAGQVSLPAAMPPGPGVWAARGAYRVEPTRFGAYFTPADGDAADTSYTVRLDGAVYAEVTPGPYRSQESCVGVLQGGQSSVPQGRCLFRLEVSGLAEGSAHQVEVEACSTAGCMPLHDIAVSLPGRMAERGRCADGLDNDGDGGTDCADDDCRGSAACPLPETACADGLDNDGDGGTDCADADCGSSPSCDPGRVCASAADCDDGNPCTEDVCEGSPGSCRNLTGPGAAVPSGPYPPGSPCWQHYWCIEGHSVGTEYTCDDGNPCTEDLCDASGACGQRALPDGETCGTTCTQGGVCMLGQCTGAAPVPCEDDNPCTEDLCDPVEGCVFPALEGVACTDYSVCTEGDVCVEGACMSGAAPSCDDGDPCTEDFCDGVRGCVNRPGALDCDDGDACTAGDRCDALGWCAAGVTTDCDDGNPCTADSCDPAEGCVHAPAAVQPAFCGSLPAGARVLSWAQVSLELTGAQVERVKVELEGGATNLLVVDAQTGTDADITVLWDAEEQAIRQLRGRMGAGLYARVQGANPADRLTVLLWSSRSLGGSVVRKELVDGDAVGLAAREQAAAAAAAALGQEIAGIYPEVQVAAVPGLPAVWVEAGAADVDRIARDPVLGEAGGMMLASGLPVVPTAAGDLGTGAEQVHGWAVTGVGQRVGLALPQSPVLAGGQPCFGALSEGPWGPERVPPAGELSAAMAGLLRADPGCVDGRGLAPGAELLVGYPAEPDLGAPQLHTALTWLVESQGLKLVGMGWTRSSALPEEARPGAYELLADELVRGAPYPLVVAPAGNRNGGAAEGYAECSTDAQAAYVQSRLQNGLVVGAVDGQGTVDPGDDILYGCGSWRNPWSLHGDLELPHLVAPGVNVKAGGAAPRSGTSLAAAVVTAEAALLVQANPELADWPEAQRAVLMASAAGDVDGGRSYGCDEAVADPTCGRDGAGVVSLWRALHLGAPAARLQKPDPSGVQAGARVPLHGYDMATMALPAGTDPEDGSLLDAAGAKLSWRFLLAPRTRTRAVLSWDALPPSERRRLDPLGVDLDLDLRCEDAQGSPVLRAGGYGWDRSVEVVTLQNPSSHALLCTARVLELRDDRSGQATDPTYTYLAFAVMPESVDDCDGIPMVVTNDDRLAEVDLPQQVFCTGTGCPEAIPYEFGIPVAEGVLQANSTSEALSLLSAYLVDQGTPASCIAASAGSQVPADLRALAFWRADPAESRHPIKWLGVTVLDRGPDAQQVARKLLLCTGELKLCVPRFVQAVGASWATPPTAPATPYQAPIMPNPDPRAPDPLSPLNWFLPGLAGLDWVGLPALHRGLVCDRYSFGGWGPGCGSLDWCPDEPEAVCIHTGPGGLRIALSPHGGRVIYRFDAVDGDGKIHNLITQPPPGTTGPPNGPYLAAREHTVPDLLAPNYWLGHDPFALVQVEEDMDQHVTVRVEGAFCPAGTSEADAANICLGRAVWRLTFYAKTGLVHSEPTFVWGEPRQRLNVYSAFLVIDEDQCEVMQPGLASRYNQLVVDGMGLRLDLAAESYALHPQGAINAGGDGDLAWVQVISDHHISDSFKAPWFALQPGYLLGTLYLQGAGESSGTAAALALALADMHRTAPKAYHLHPGGGLDVEQWPLWHQPGQQWEQEVLAPALALSAGGEEELSEAGKKALKAYFDQRGFAHVGPLDFSMRALRDPSTLLGQLVSRLCNTDCCLLPGANKSACDCPAGSGTCYARMELPVPFFRRVLPGPARTVLSNAVTVTDAGVEVASTPAGPAQGSEAFGYANTLCRDLLQVADMPPHAYGLGTTQDLWLKAGVVPQGAAVEPGWLGPLWKLANLPRVGLISPEEAVATGALEALGAGPEAEVLTAGLRETFEGIATLLDPCTWDEAFLSPGGSCGAESATPPYGAWNYFQWYSRFQVDTGTWQAERLIAESHHFTLRVPWLLYWTLDARDAAGAPQQARVVEKLRLLKDARAGAAHLRDVTYHHLMPHDVLSELGQESGPIGEEERKLRLERCSALGAGTSDSPWRLEQNRVCIFTPMWAKFAEPPGLDAYGNAIWLGSMNDYKRILPWGGAAANDGDPESMAPRFLDYNQDLWSVRQAYYASLDRRGRDIIYELDRGLHWWMLFNSAQVADRQVAVIESMEDALAHTLRSSHVDALAATDAGEIAKGNSIPVSRIVMDRNNVPAYLGAPRAEWLLEGDKPGYERFARFPMAWIRAAVFRGSWQEAFSKALPDGILGPEVSSAFGWSTSATSAGFGFTGFFYAPRWLRRVVETELSLVPELGVRVMRLWKQIQIVAHAIVFRQASFSYPVDLALGAPLLVGADRKNGEQVVFPLTVLAAACDPDLPLNRSTGGANATVPPYPAPADTTSSTPANLVSPLDPDLCATALADSIWRALWPQHLQTLFADMLSSPSAGGRLQDAHRAAALGPGGTDVSNNAFIPNDLLPAMGVLQKLAAGGVVVPAVTWDQHPQRFVAGALPTRVGLATVAVLPDAQRPAAAGTKYRVKLLVLSTSATPDSGRVLKLPLIDPSAPPYCSCAGSVCVDKQLPPGESCPLSMCNPGCSDTPGKCPSITCRKTPEPTPTLRWTPGCSPEPLVTETLHYYKGTLGPEDSSFLARAVRKAADPSGNSRLSPPNFMQSIALGDCARVEVVLELSSRFYLVEPTVPDAGGGRDPDSAVLLRMFPETSDATPWRYHAMVGLPPGHLLCFQGKPGAKTFLPFAAMGPSCRFAPAAASDASAPTSALRRESRLRRSSATPTAFPRHSPRRMPRLETLATPPICKTLPGDMDGANLALALYRLDENSGILQATAGDRLGGLFSWERGIWNALALDTAFLGGGSALTPLLGETARYPLYDEPDGPTGSTWCLTASYNTSGVAMVEQIDRLYFGAPEVQYLDPASGLRAHLPNAPTKATGSTSLTALGLPYDARPGGCDVLGTTDCTSSCNFDSALDQEDTLATLYPFALRSRDACVAQAPNQGLHHAMASCFVSFSPSEWLMLAPSLPALGCVALIDESGNTCYEPVAGCHELSLPGSCPPPNGTRCDLTQQ